MKIILDNTESKLLEENFVDITNLYEKDHLKGNITKRLIQFPDVLKPLTEYTQAEDTTRFTELFLMALNRVMIQTTNITIEKGT